ncbi:MAG: DUF1887 family protein [Methylomonas sp.]|nr:DUF1887 family protein [Methylomonas sp.]PPD21144.1 MAG: hypothetical protein CTY23_06550 [Methylomonas sp.]PPD27578.1 MAG: hypothetical protein CTY22_01580 [Methylomonas sp.]PPD39574.1 MAG: hypothetical protein CTY21_01575 [Methylomonas sp.]PPD55825.1 MAG: hypothetical protein CTY11_00845 [Methylomonas sp.]
MSTPDIHLLIVTGQAQANLIPVMQLKPHIIALAISQAMKTNAEQFIKLLTRLAGYSEENIVQYHNVPDVGLDAIKDRALEIEDHLNQRFPEHPIVYHATGGTKLIALGFYDVFHRPPNRVVYTDTAHGQIEILYPAKSPSIAIDKVLTLESYLLSMDKQMRKSADDTWQTNARQRRKLSIWLAQNTKQLQSYWRVINTLAHNALAQPQRGQPPALAQPLQTFETGKAPFRPWQTALAKCSQAGLCGWDSKTPHHLYFKSADAAQYLSGGWLEEYVWLTASELGCDEVHANVFFTETGNPKDDIRNEMDCLILHNNRLLMIECKTGAFKADDPKSDGILYKLHTLENRTGGLFGDAWLVSARTLDDATQNRAHEYKIKIIQGGNIKQLKNQLQNWMNGGSAP